MGNTPVITVKKRNCGVDLLRIISMFFVVVVHIMGHAGIIRSLDGRSVSYALLQAINVIAHTAIVILLMISGFVGYRGENTKPNYKNLLSIYFQVQFYSFGISLILKIINPDIMSGFELFKTLLPVTSDQYWFFTNYFVLALAAPVINRLVYSFNEKECFAAALASLFFLSLYSWYSAHVIDPFMTRNGTGYIWFFELYYIGAIIRKYDLYKRVGKKMCVWGFLLGFFASYIPALLYPYFPDGIMGKILAFVDERLYDYMSPLFLIMSLSILFLVLKMKISDRAGKTIVYFATTCFSVYLIHDHDYLRDFYIKGLLSSWAQMNPLLLAVCILSLAAAVFLVCTFIDKLRVLLFKLVRADDFAAYINNIACKIFGGVADRLVSKETGNDNTRES